MTPAHIKVLGALALLTGFAWVIGCRVQNGDGSQGQQVNRISERALVVLSLFALPAVVSGYFFPGPTRDEGVAAHIFQPTMVALAPAGALFAGTAKWSGGWLRTARPLAVPAVAVALAFGMLFFLEHQAG